MAIVNGLRRQASAGEGMEEAGKLMIPHHSEHKTLDVFCPKEKTKHQKQENIEANPAV